MAYWTHDPQGCFLPEGPFLSCQDAIFRCQDLLSASAPDRTLSYMHIMSGPEDVPDQTKWTFVRKVEAA